MELFFEILEWTYRLGVMVLFGNNGTYATLRVVLIGVALGIIGYAPLSTLIILWASYVWLYALWDPKLREFSGIDFGRVVLLCVAFAASSLGMNASL